MEYKIVKCRSFIHYDNIIIFIFFLFYDSFYFNNNELFKYVAADNSAVSDFSYYHGHIKKKLNHRKSERALLT